MVMLNAQLPYFAQQLFIPKRYKVFYGGRGAARSWSFARALLIKGSQQKIRILCCREFQKSIADSVHKLLKEQIELMGIPGWRVQKASIVHAGTGSEFLFEGLRYNVNRIKSIEGVDICWVEEAESVSSDSWQILIPTIRKPGSEIWISFNPDLYDDPTYQRFVVGQPPNAIVQKVGWQDNPWFGDELREEKDYLYSVDPDAAEHVWGGEPRHSTEAQILHKKWKSEAFEVENNWLGPYYGLDFGFAVDPTALVECWIVKEPGRFKKYSKGRLYIRHEAWKINLDIHKMTAFFYPIFGRELSQQIIRADSARPETISYLKQHGLRRIVGAFKWPGSVEDGIAYLRQFEEIIIHPECPQTKQEAKLWSYKVDDKTQEILPDVVDKHNHTWDGVRYALTPLIRAARGMKHSYTGQSYATNG